MLTLVLSTVLLAAEPATPAPASTAAQVDALVREAYDLRQRHRPEEALARLEQADALLPSPKVAAQRGLVETSLRRWVAAERHLLTALSSDDPWVEKNRASLGNTLSQVLTHLSHLSVSGRTGTQLTVDGHAVGLLPMNAPLSLEPGDVAVVGTLPGFFPAKVTVHLQAEQNAAVSLQQLPEPSAAPAAAATPPAPAASAPPSDSPPRWLPWTGGALAAAGLTSVAFGVYWLHSDGRSSCGTLPVDQRCDRVYDTGTQGYIATGLGAVAIIGGGLMIWQGLARPTDHVALLPNGLVARF